MQSYTTSTFFTNNGKSINYVFNVSAKYINGLKKVKFTKSWTPNF